MPTQLSSSQESHTEATGKGFSNPVHTPSPVVRHGQGAMLPVSDNQNWIHEPQYAKQYSLKVLISTQTTCEVTIKLKLIRQVGIEARNNELASFSINMSNYMYPVAYTV